MTQTPDPRFTKPVMMDVFDGTAPLPDRYRGGIAALGNFDGFHLGHQAVVGHARDMAREAGRPALVITFDPHPARHFRPDAPPFALTTVPQRLALLDAFGMDAAVVIPFDAGIAALGAHSFAADWLRDRLGVAGVVTGDDFTYGAGRSGNVGVLRTEGPALGFTAHTVAAVRADGDAVVSSTHIRQLLQGGDPAGAGALLSRPFTITGIVAHGAKLGRTLDFPTANLALGPYVRPAYGVYAVRVRLADGSLVNGVANLGIRPMFDPPVELLETFLFDWSGDLYGQEIAVELHAFLRPEWKLDGLAALKAQIAKDCAAARDALAGR